MEIIKNIGWSLLLMAAVYISLIVLTNQIIAGNL